MKKLLLILVLMLIPFVSVFADDWKSEFIDELQSGKEISRFLILKSLHFSAIMLVLNKLFFTVFTSIFPIFS